MKTLKMNNVNYIVGEETEFIHNGAERKSIKCRLPKGKNLIMITKYEDGTFSSPTKTHFKASF